MKIKDYQVRKKWFFAVPSIFPNWPYASRLAIGIKLADAEYRNAPYFRFRIKDTLYEISSDRAVTLGQKFIFPNGALPNLLPKEEFKIIKTDLPIEPVWEFDYKKNIARLKVPKSMKEMTVQLSIV